MTGTERWRPELRGTGHGTPVLLLNPLGMDRRCWSPVTAHWADRSLLTCDFPGHGRSPVVDPGTTIADLAADLAAALTDVLDRTRTPRVHVVGMSLGGLVAQRLAATRADLVDHLVLVNTVATYPPAQQEQWTERAAVARAEGLAPLIDPTLRNFFTPDFLRDEPAVADLVRAMLSDTTGEGYAVMCEALRDADTTGLVGEITAPTLVVCGRQDAPPFVAAAPWLTESIAGARLHWIEQAQHAAALQHPQAFATVVGDFLG
jgi:3-oxoadipate enol-lactonase